jgi:hypothetical protein
LNQQSGAGAGRTGLLEHYGRQRQRGNRAVTDHPLVPDGKHENRFMGIPSSIYDFCIFDHGSQVALVRNTDGENPLAASVDIHETGGWKKCRSVELARGSGLSIDVRADQQAAIVGGVLPGRVEWVDDHELQGRFWLIDLKSAKRAEPVLLDGRGFREVRDVQFSVDGKTFLLIAEYMNEDARAATWSASCSAGMPCRLILSGRWNSTGATRISRFPRMAR